MRVAKNNILKSTFLCGLGILLLIVSCEKELDLEMPIPEPKVVVEGWIEQDLSAKILLTHSVPYFTELDSATLMKIPIKSAKVTVVTDEEEEILTLKPNTSFFPPFVYNSNNLKGKVNSIYTLIIEYQGRTITAQTSIPDPVKLDSVWFQYEPGNDTLGRVWIQLTDNPGQENFYRVFTRRMGKDNRYVPSYISVFSDKVFSGGTVKIGLLRGTGSILQLGESRYFNKGDTIQVKFCTMNKEHFEFWDSLQAEIITSSNPFAASNARVKSNLSEGLGVWGGYGVTFYTVTAY